MREPGPSVTPVPVRGRRRDTEKAGGFRRSEASKIAELHQLGFGGLVPSELLERQIEGDDLRAILWGDKAGKVQVAPLHAAAAFGSTFAPRRIDEDPPHRLGGCGEEVASAIPKIGPADADQSDISLVNQSGRLERVSGSLLGEPGGG